MKKIISVLVITVFIAGMAFAVDEAATTAQAGAGKTAVSKPPVGSAAIEVTKEATGVVTQGMERRQTRREDRRETLLGEGKEKEIKKNVITK